MTLIPRYEGVVKERRGVWVVVGMVFTRKHGLHRINLHRFGNKLGRIDHFNRAKALGTPWLPRGLPRHRTSVAAV